MNKFISFRDLCFCALMVCAFSACNHSFTISIRSDHDAPQIQYAISKLKGLAQSNTIRFSDKNPHVIINTSIDSVHLKKEAYKIDVQKDRISVQGGDPVGVMYGLLELNSQFKSGIRVVKPKEESPNVYFRAIKFNLPWSTYRNSESLSLHYETCRDTLFWEAFLDMMVENRFNKLTLWNLHPFNYLVKTKKYPEASSFTDQEMADWQKFWHTLFHMAKDRGIETYLMNWNIFVSPEFAKAHNVAPYCLTNEFNVHKGDTSEIIKDYTRESVKAVIDTYPDLTGLGITLGEGMGGMTAEEREQWLLDSYIMGMRMASRKVRFIHRVPLSAGTSSGGSTSVAVEQMTRNTLDSLSCVEGPVNIELKFNWSHAFSTPNLVKVHGGELTDAYWNPMPKNHYLSWMMRNEDFFMLRWGQPDFIREHVARNVHPYVNGYYLGSETYIPAKDYITALKGTSYRYAFERQWMYYKVCGRLFYNPNTPDKVFEDAFESRFPGLGEKLFSAQTKASKIPLIVASYQNATADLSLYTEGMLKKLNNDPKFVGLIPLTEIANKIPMAPNYMSITDYLKNANHIALDKITPVQLADSLNGLSRQALLEVKDIRVGDNMDLLYEVADIKTWAHLGTYFSNRLRAAIEYKRFELTQDEKAIQNAIMWLSRAVDSWHKVVEITKPIYEPVPLTHLTFNKDKYFHWSKIEDQVVAELQCLQSLNK